MKGQSREGRNPRGKWFTLSWRCSRPGTQHKAKSLFVFEHAFLFRAPPRSGGARQR
jgi:hypothetical protein